MTTNKDSVSVEQVDREAAADIWRDYIAKVGEVMVERQMREGAHDYGLPKYLARHRIEATRQADADKAELVEALNGLCRYEGHMVYCGHGKDDMKPCVCGLIEAQEKATATITKHRRPA